MTKNRLHIQTLSSFWLIKQIGCIIQFGLVKGRKVLANSLQNQISRVPANKHIYNKISSQLTVENNNLKYSFYINKFIIFSILNHLKAGATL